MKNIRLFKEFLEDTVNLTPTKISSLEGSVAAIENAVDRADWGPEILEYYEQGSWAHKTIIKPPKDKPFDADLLVIVKPVEGWEAKDYVNKLATKLEALATYEGKVERSSHCVTINYAGDKRIDIAPCLKGRLYPNKYEVCNRGPNEFEQSEPVAYTKWVKTQNATVGSNDLIKATRLLKYLRDIKQTFTCPSFLLTTLLGYQVNSWDKGTLEMADLPTVFKTIVGRLDDWLQQRINVPVVENPVLSNENQASGWSQTQYDNFRDKIHKYRGWIDEAYDETEEDESIGKWRRVFGSEFAKNHVKRVAASISSVGQVTELAKSLESYSSGPRHSSALDLVHRVRSLGLRAIPSRLIRLPHVQRVRWKAVAGSDARSVKVQAVLAKSSYATNARSVTSGEPLAPHQSITFTATGVGGQPFTSDYTVYWQVANTDKEAEAKDCLRGEFIKSDAGTSHTEELLYRGVHFVRAHLVRKKDKALIGVSEPFYVVIDSPISA